MPQFAVKVNLSCGATARARTRETRWHAPNVPERRWHAGRPVHHHIEGVPLLGELHTAPKYRFYSVRDEFPALVPTVAGGAAIIGELYDLPLDMLHHSLLPAEPPELELGTIELEDGFVSFAMLLRRRGP